MTTSRTVSAGADPDRHLNHARAALREAAECLEEAAANGERPAVHVSSALSNVAAARTALRSRGLGGTSGAIDAA